MVTCADIENHITAFCGEYGISVNLSRQMPAGYETAYGTYDVTVNTLFLNTRLLRDAPEYEVLFYLFHELRHGAQYLRPELFEAAVRESRFYVVLFNGTCFRLEGNGWRQVRLEGAEAYFTRAYLSLPYERDANAFAYERVKVLCGDGPELRKLYAFWQPMEQMPYGELKKLFQRIDEATADNQQ